MHALTDTFAGLMLDWAFNIGNPTRPTTFFAALHSGAPGPAGASNELTGNGYARTAFTPERSGRLIRNTGAITFPTVTGSNWAEALFASCWSASTSGTCYFTSPLAAAVSRSFTIDDTTADTVELPAHGFSNNDRVFVQQFSGLALPTGLNANTVYFVVNATADDLQLSTTQGGGAVAITGAGVGTIQRITNARTALVGDTVQFAAQALSFQFPAAA